MSIAAAAFFKLRTEELVCREINLILVFLQADRGRYCPLVTFSRAADRGELAPSDGRLGLARQCLFSVSPPATVSLKQCNECLKVLPLHLNFHIDLTYECHKTL